MIRELKKLWHPIHFVVILLVIAGTMWNLHNSMYNGAYFLRDEMIAAWEDVLAQDDRWAMCKRIIMKSTAH